MKKKIGVIFGGMSTEHNVSIKSGCNVIRGFNRDKYDITPIYIDKNGSWFYLLDDRNFSFNEGKLFNIKNIFVFLKGFDVLFPVLHGKYGEDGSIQGLFELLKVPYVGCGVLSSALTLDKVYTKFILDRASIKQAKYVYIKCLNNNYIYVDNNFNEKNYSLEDLCDFIQSHLKYPMFVKPSNLGSSIGISRVLNSDELRKGIMEASKLDYKVLVEEELLGKEIECAVLGNEIVLSSVLGEIVSPNHFYSYDSKYENNDSKLIIPADISEELSNKVRKCAAMVFKATLGKGLARVDFFVDGDEIYVNEINSLPGFTDISMYPMLWKKSGLSLEKLLDKLIDLALK